MGGSTQCLNALCLSFRLNCVVEDESLDIFLGTGHKKWGGGLQYGKGGGGGVGNQI